MRAAAAAAGRAAAPPRVAHVSVALSEDREAVREAGREQLGRYSRLANYQGMFQAAGFSDPPGKDLDAIVDTLVVSGSEAVIADRLGVILNEGAGEIIVHPVFLDEDRAAYQSRVLDLVARANREAGVQV